MNRNRFGRKKILSGRPSELPAADNVNVNVVDTLTSFGAVVDHGTESLREALLLRDLLGMNQGGRIRLRRERDGERDS